MPKTFDEIPMGVTPNGGSIVANTGGVG